MNYSLKECKAFVESCFKKNGIHTIDLIRGMRNAYIAGEKNGHDKAYKEIDQLRRDYEILQARFDELRMAFNKISKRINRDVC